LFSLETIIAADGPENSVPAIGCVAIKFLLLGLAIPSQIGFCRTHFKNNLYHHKSTSFGSTTSATSTGTETITKSASASLQCGTSINNTQSNA
jgi:hypothetical protein